MSEIHVKCVEINRPVSEEESDRYVLCSESFFAVNSNYYLDYEQNDAEQALSLVCINKRKLLRGSPIPYSS